MTTETPQNELIRAGSTKEKVPRNPQRSFIRDTNAQAKELLPAKREPRIKDRAKDRRGRTLKFIASGKVIGNPQAEYIQEKFGRIKIKENHYQKIVRLFPLYMGIAAIAIVLLAILSVSIGEINIPFAETYRVLIGKLLGLDNIDSSLGTINIIWKVRFPRIIMALLVGAGLSLCGVVMQSSVRNPLADPYILGTSSGASLGATFSIMLGLGGIPWARTVGVSTSAFIGALGASMLVLLIAGSSGRMTPVKLVLGGTVINMICGTFSSIIVFLFPSQDGMQTATYWLMGSLAVGGYGDLIYIAALTIVAIVFFFTQSRIMNAMMLGDEGATTLGINTARYRFVYMIVSALLVGFMVTKCGIIGYVGLIIPHISRGLVGADHKKLIPFAVCLGALFLLLCDVISRSIMNVVFHKAGILPLGLITSAVGAPILLHRIIRQGFASGNS